MKTVEPETRTDDHLTLVEGRRLKTATAARSYIPRTIISWNHLPLDIREIEDNNTFKNRLKNYIRDNIPVK